MSQAKFRQFSNILNSATSDYLIISRSKNWFAENLSETIPASGGCTLETALHKQIKFEYTKALKQNENGGWFANGGTLMNLDPIGSITSLKITCAYMANFAIEYGWDLAADGRPCFEESVITSYCTAGEVKIFNFNNEKPNYIKLTMNSFSFEGKRGFVDLTIDFSSFSTEAQRIEPYKNYKKSAKTLEMEALGYRNIINDERFRKGFVVSKKDVVSPDSGYFDVPLRVTNNSAWQVVPTPTWDMGQWMTQKLFDTTKPENTDDGEYINNYVNRDSNMFLMLDRTKKNQAVGYDAAKKFLIDYSNTDGLFSMECNSGAEYKDNVEEYSVSHHGPWWVHFLIQQNFTDKFFGVKVSDLASFIPYFEYKMNSMAGSGGMATNDVQLNFYIRIQNLNPESAGYSDYIWFGGSLFEKTNDTVVSSYPEYYGYEYQQEAFIYRPASSLMYTNGLPTTPGVTNTLTCGNILSLISTALDAAHQSGALLNTTLDDLYIAGFNFGFENRGHYQAVVEMKNLGLYIKYNNFFAPVIPDGGTYDVRNAKIKDFTNNFIKEYSAKYKGNKLDQKPDQYKNNPLVLSWATSDIFDSYVVDVSLDPLFATYSSYPCTDKQISIENVYTDKTYYWRVNCIKDGVISSTGDLYSVHVNKAPRLVNIDSVTNTRDIGGYYTANKKIKQGLVIRSANFPDITATGKSILVDNFKINTELELGLTSGTSPLGVNLISIDPFPYWTGGVWGIDDQTYWPAVKEAIEVFADINNYPIIFHCWLGQDRTGTLAILLEGLCGIDLQDIFMEYELTSFSSVTKEDDPVHQSIQHKYYYQVDPLITYLKSFGSETDTFQTCVINFLTNNVGVSSQDITTIQNILLEDR